MWVYDGEEWTEEGTGDKTKTPEAQRPRYDEMTPELQVIEVEIVQVPRSNPIPPFPLP
jgi:hypothetical protein